MLINNIKIAIRHIGSQKLYSGIKIGGLAIGIAAMLLLMIYLKYESSYDNFYIKKEQIHRVTVKYLKEGFSGVDFPAPFAKAIKNDFPEVLNAGRLIPAKWFNQVRTTKEKQNFFEDKIAYADSEWMDILSLPVVYGNCVKGMEEPNTISISKSIAKKMFPNQNPINEFLIINDNQEVPFKVVGVYEDFPSNSHLELDLIISLEGVEFWEGEQSYWGTNMYDVYTLLKKGTDIENLNEKLSSLTTNYLLPSWIEREFVNPYEIADNQKYELQPIQDIYLESSDIRDGLSHGDQRMIWLFGAAGVLIILIACINYINLSIARHSIRVKEISTRKILGANKREIIGQLLSESILFSFVSFSIGSLIAWAVLPYFNELVDKTLTFPWKTSNSMLVFLISILGLGFATGIYPSLFLSNFKPSPSSLKLKEANRNLNFQKLLVVFQFTVSITLIICTAIVFQQMEFILNKDLGFEKDQVLTIKGTNALAKNETTFKQELLELNAVKSISIGGYLPIKEGHRYSDSFWKDGTQNVEQGVNAQIWQVDQEYINTLGIDLISGRNFNEKLGSDSSAVIISQSLSQKLGFENSLDQSITNKENKWNIIGVIHDFHFESLKSNIAPLCIVLGKNSSMISIKFNSKNTEQLLGSVEEIWKKFVPENQLQYSFLDESFTKMHDDVHRTARLFNVFALLAIVIACLGLFGLTTFITEQREKEIGIRKVLGAKVTSILFLLSKDFLKLIFIAILIAVPMGWYIQSEWLKNFAYHIELEWWIFALAGSGALIIAFFTVSSKAFFVALTNPVESLRNE